MSEDLKISERHRDFARQSYSAHLDEAGRHLQMQADFGLTALKNAVLVNGGAIIALLTLVGSKSTELDPSNLEYSIMSFAGGLVLAMLGMVSASASQSYFFGYWKALAWEAQAESNGMRGDSPDANDLSKGNRLLFVANSASVFSIASFVAGACFGVDGLS